MATQKTKGAKPVLDRLYGLIDLIGDESAKARKLAIYNPPFARDKLIEIEDHAADLKRLIQEQVEPFMERQAPQYEQRLAQLEERIAALEDSGMRIIRQAK